MNEKKDKKSKKPEYVSKNWKSSQGIRLLAMVLAIVRSEERRVGKECRSRWSPYH